MKKLIEHVICHSCGSEYDCERKRDILGNYKNTIDGAILCGNCGCRNSELVEIESHEIEV